MKCTGSETSSKSYLLFVQFIKTADGFAETARSCSSRTLSNENFEQRMQKGITVKDMSMFYVLAGEESSFQITQT